MPMFRKKPVVIEARKFDGTFASAAPLIRWIGHEEAAWCDDGTMWIPTLEGGHTASPGDWIIKGVAGEFYPCKPDIFRATYDNA